MTKYSINYIKINVSQVGNILFLFGIAENVFLSIYCKPIKVMQDH